MASEEGVKGNKKGVPVWTFVKNASLAITIFLFFFTIVLVLDAYKFVSVRVSRNISLLYTAVCCLQLLIMHIRICRCLFLISFIDSINIMYTHSFAAVKRGLLTTCTITQSL